jgi:hypothetical protein
VTLGSHQRAIGRSQSHFTPKWILRALGDDFDTDPAAGGARCVWRAGPFPTSHERHHRLSRHGLGSRSTIHRNEC